MGPNINLKRFGVLYYSVYHLCCQGEKMKVNYTKDLIEDICKNSNSYRQCLNKLGLKEAGGNYACIKKKIAEYNIDISHFHHKAWNKGKKNEARKRKIEDYFSNKYRIQSYKLKKRLLDEEYFEYKCQNCNQSNWMDCKIPLELHHIDGNNLNNNLNNLSLLCPNCHALTDNYRAKNKNRSSRIRTDT